jgi:putative ABC transport system permease protein
MDTGDRARDAAARLESLLQDVRFAARRLRRAPGFLAAALSTLALGIGACVAIFSVVSNVLLRPLPFPEPERLVVLRETFFPTVPDSSVSIGRYFEWQAAPGLERVGALDGMSYNLGAGGALVHLYAARITASLLGTLRVAAVAGRNFVDADEIPFDRDNVAMLSHRLWLRRFAGRADIIGTTVQLNGRPFTVVGVLPRESGLPERIEVVTPLALRQWRTNYEYHGLQVVGRMRPGTTAAQTERELNLVADRTARVQPRAAGWKVKVFSLMDSVVAPVRPALLALLAAVGFLLLIACVNVANLLLARASGRSAEMAVRAALGATRARVVWQLLVESLLLAVVGGGLGLVVAKAGLVTLLAMAPDTLPRAGQIGIDGAALGFTLVLTILTGLGFGIVPAFQTSRGSPNDAFKQGGRGATSGAHHRRLRDALAVAEVALALWLLAGAGLVMRTFTRLQEVDPGFNPRDAHVAAVFLPRPAYLRPVQHVAFAQQVMRELAGVPGVQVVAAAANIPFSAIHLTDLSATTRSFFVAGRRPATDAEIPISSWYTVTPDYFRAMGISVLRGRAFDGGDVAGGHQVAMISDSVARRFFPAEDPLGKAIRIGATMCEIVGIAADVKATRLDGPSTLQTYQPFAQSPDNDIVFVVRTAPQAVGIPDGIRRAIARIDPGIPLYDDRPLASLLGASLARQRFAATLFAVFSAVALLLAAIGVYGVMAYSVSRRTREIGVRMALGARTGDVLRLVFTQALAVIATGLVIGIAGGLLSTRLLETLLFGVSTHDPAAFVTAAGLMTIVAACACLLPARQAARGDPMTALRSE